MPDEKDYLNERWEVKEVNPFGEPFYYIVYKGNPEHRSKICSCENRTYANNIANNYNTLIEAGIPADKLDMIPKMVELLKMIIKCFKDDN